MLHAQYQWKLPNTNTDEAGLLAKDCGISPLLAGLLLNRGIHTSSAAHRFLYEAEDIQHDPFLLSGLQEAVSRIRQALEQGEHILVYGDYDADGVSSTSLMIQLMRKLEASFDFYIPHRTNEGYGLHNHVLDWAQQQGVTLVITVDTGISAVDQIAYARTLGIDVIVTDHHEPPEVLPDAYTLVNPKIPTCTYPFKGLAGVGVALKLAQGLLGEEVPEEWLQIAAVGTVADLMPLHDENRSIVRRGVASMRVDTLIGIKALLGVAGVQPDQVTSTNIAFSLAPRINAAGRMEHAGKAVALMTADSPDEADRIAYELDLLNKERQQLVNRIYDEAVAMLEEKIQDKELPSVIVLAGEGWNPGVIGIVASRILDRYYRPTIILGIDSETGMCKGSARSIPEFDIYTALTTCREWMDHFGGHHSAAGMSLHREQLQKFDEQLNVYASQELEAEQLVQSVAADGNCRLAELNLEAVEQLEQLQPFGMDNPAPTFVLPQLKLREARKMGKEKNHLKLILEQDGRTLDAVAFGRGELADYLEPGQAVDVLGELSINEWNGRRTVQLMLKDLRAHGFQIFDFRGQSNPLAVFERCVRNVHPGLENSRSYAIAMRSNSSVYQPDAMNKDSIWIYDQQEGVRPYGDGERKLTAIAPSEVRSLFLLDPPESAEQMRRLRTVFSNVDNIFVLHATHSFQGRLQIPSREQFKRIYVQLRALGPGPLEEQKILPTLSRQTSCSVRMLTGMLDVFQELGFVMRADGQLSIVANPPKQDLTTSSRYQELHQGAEMEQMLLDAETGQLTNWMKAVLKGAS